MKLLFENWRKFLIERETDQVYSDIIDFLAAAFADKKNYDFLSDEEAESYGEEKIDFSDPKWQDLKSTFKNLPEPDPNEPRHRDYMLNEARIEDLYDELTKKIPDSKQIIDSSKTFFDMLYGLQLYIEYDLKEKNTGGYFSGDTVAVNFGSSRMSPPLTVEEFNALSDEEIFKILKNNTNMIKRTLEHEFTHMLNVARGSKLVDTATEDAIKYVNSTRD
jgi:hypothetical protein